MNNFLNLRAEKQDHIINAAFHIFGRNGYKKASFSDIAEEAGIAKGMINYYFGSKKNLYLYLVELSTKSITKEMSKGFDDNVTDFFDNIKMLIDIKIAMIKDHPSILSFATSVFYETDQEVTDEIKEWMSQNMEFRERMLHNDKIDVSRFKDDVDPKLLDKFIYWVSEGFASSIRNDLKMDEIDAFVKELYVCLDLMKKYFYKE